MSVPDRICGLEVRHCADKSGRVLWHEIVLHGNYVETGRWDISKPHHESDPYRASHRYGNDEEECWRGTEAEVIAAVEASIRSVAEECRAFADKVLGER